MVNRACGKSGMHKEEYKGSKYRPSPLHCMKKQQKIESSLIFNSLKTLHVQIEIPDAVA